MLTMGMSFETSSTTVNDVLKGVNLVFSAIFLVEAVLKLVAFGGSYFQNSWNKFDFFVVVTSFGDVALLAL